MTEHVIQTPIQTDILLIRHAETALRGTFCGHTDPPLSPTGREQLPGLLDRLRPFPIAAIYTSDLRRAMETGEPIAQERGIPNHALPELREIFFGEWETLDWDAIQLRDPEFAQRWVIQFPSLPTPGGEPIVQFRSRILAVFNRLREAAASESIAVVTHAGVLRVLLEELAHTSAHHAWERTRQYTGVIHFIQQGPRGSLELRS